MIRGRRRHPAESIRVLPQGATLVVEVEGETTADELETIGRAMSGPNTVVFVIHGKVREDSGR